MEEHAGDEEGPDRGNEAAQMALALRNATERRQEWPAPILLLRFMDGEAPEGTGAGPYAAVSQEAAAGKSWPGSGRPYEVVAEFDEEELEELADYDDEDLLRYVAEILIW